MNGKVKGAHSNINLIHLNLETNASQRGVLGKGLCPLRNMVQKASGISLEIFNVGNDMSIVPLPAAPYGTAECRNTHVWADMQCRRALTDADAICMSEVPAVVRRGQLEGQQQKAEGASASVKVPLKALHTPREALHLNDSGTPRTQKVSELVSERSWIRCPVSCSVPHWIQPPMEDKGALPQDHKQHSKKPSAQELVWIRRVFRGCSHLMNKSRSDDRGIIRPHPRDTGYSEVWQRQQDILI